MTRSIILLFTFIIILLINCVNIRIIPYEDISREPKPKNHPIPILESTKINKPYKVIGAVEANAGKLHSVNDTIEQLKNAARKMGGDALIEFQNGPSNSGIISSIGKNYYYGNVREIWSAKVIVWENN